MVATTADSATSGNAFVTLVLSGKLAKRKSRPARTTVWGAASAPEAGAYAKLDSAE